MKLYIKQKVFSWADKFTVSNEAGDPRYYVEGEIFSWGKKLHIYDRSGQELALIQEKVFSFLPRYFVFMDGDQVAEIVKEFTFFRPRYRIDGLDWIIDGSFWEHDYQIVSGNEQIVSIHKEWMTWGDCYELDITDEQDELLALSVVLTIDCVIAAAAAAAN